MKYRYGFTGTHSVAHCGFAVWVQVKHTTGTGFVGTGVGWTSPTHAVPMCHPTDNHPTQSACPLSIHPDPQINMGLNKMKDHIS